MADMSSFKSRITTIIKKTNEQFGDINDILDFQGISTKLIAQSLGEIHSQLSELEKRKETFEVILLKRFLDSKISELKIFFEEKIDPHNFNNFLNNIAEIKFRVKETYFLVITEIIRTEAAIAKSKDALITMQNIHEKLIAENNLISPILEKIKLENEDYKKRMSEIETIIEKAEEVHSEYEDIINSLNSLKEENQKANADFKNVLQTSRSHNTAIDSQNNKTQKIIKDLTTTKERNELAEQKLIELQSQSEKQSAVIHEILADANRASMAGSFKEQMETLEEPQRIAERNKIISLIFIYITLIVIFTNCFGFYILPNVSEYIGWATKISIISPLIWIAWNETRKQNILSRMKADYAYKYASAVAFEGYNRKAGEISEEMQRKLLDIAINNLGNNPVRLFNEKDIHGSPLESILKRGEETIKNATSKI